MSPTTDLPDGAPGGGRGYGRRAAVAAAVAAVVLAAVVLAVLPAGHHAAGHRESATGTRARLSHVAADELRVDRGHVTRAEAVRTSYLRAEHAVFGGDTTNTPAGGTRVWIVQIEGTGFLCDSCRYPAGMTAPRGRVMTVVLIARTFAQVGFGLTNRAHDLARLGPVTILHP